MGFQGGKKCLLVTCMAIIFSLMGIIFPRICNISCHIRACIYSLSYQYNFPINSINSVDLLRFSYSYALTCDKGRQSTDYCVILEFGLFICSNVFWSVLLVVNDQIGLECKISNETSMQKGCCVKLVRQGFIFRCKMGC